MQTHQQQDSTHPDNIDLGKLVGILLDSKWIIIGCVFLFTLLGTAYAVLSTPIYQADALVQIEKKSGGISSMIGEGFGDAFSQDSSSATEIAIIRSRLVLGETVDKLNLTTVVSPSHTAVIGKGLARLSGYQAKIQINRIEVDQDGAFNTNGAMILVLTDREEQEYDLYTGGDNKKLILSGKAGEVANNNGVELFVSVISGETGQEFVIGQVARIDAINRLKAMLRVTEEGRQTGILKLSMEGEDKAELVRLLNDISQNYFLQNVARQSAEAEKSLTFLQNQLPSIKAKLTETEDLLNNYRLENGSVDLTLEASTTLQGMIGLEAQLNELTFKESEISQRFTPDHPAYLSLLDKRKTLLNERARLEKQIQTLPQTQREVLRLTRDVEVNQQIYLQLLNKAQELQIIKAGTVGNVRILDTAQSYTHAVKPKKQVIVAIAMLAGLMLAIGIVLVRALLHKGVEAPDEIEAIGLPVYASVPRSDLQLKLSAMLKKGSPSTSAQLLAESNPADLSIEALRGLRTSLHFAMMEAKNNILMISGPAPGIGKSFISTNFAAVAAKTGQKVLLVDADMRKGYLQSQFGLKWDDGLSELLSGKLTTEQVIKASSIENLDVITRGQVPPNPSELLMHPRFKEFVEWSSENYDLVIIDTPPVLAVTDPSIVGALAGTTLMVTRFGQNTIKEIEVARGRFQQAGIEVKGVIFNAIERKASSSYGYGYYNYSYSSDSK
ncbi:polysaccharide biosynthesis tyrosine autokinase [Vibrio sp. 10N.286.48.B7]|uniref:polysaccharide biosynthesis tyrosine autokinase n=1 Tax=Vibrio sp. 10N.286.48.B7 TaxID=1880853 RepID=UPI000C834540|nr:polysaccharide biosynthesis tyrosine autokinase [Vibrio sp. 10N.286.48.B7]PMH78200.1 tyrosine-protein kinase [Vibrio sp. 10N.286.48.B7]